MHYLFTASHRVDSFVGFYAYADDGYQYPEGWDIIKFPNAFINFGGHYDPNESMFTCPVNGIYFFTFSLHTGRVSEGNRTSAYIVVDSLLFSHAFCQNNTPNAPLYTQCASSAVLYCGQGQVVYLVPMVSFSQMDGYGRASIFSGFLLHPGELRSIV